VIASLALFGLALGPAGRADLAVLLEELHSA